MKITFNLRFLAQGLHFIPVFVDICPMLFVFSLDLQSERSSFTTLGVAEYLHLTGESSKSHCKLDENARTTYSLDRRGLTSLRSLFFLCRLRARCSVSFFLAS